MERDRDLLELEYIEDSSSPKNYPMWHVVFYNDDYTPMDFVVEMLQKHFGHTEESATVIMYDVHTKGEAIAGTYVRDIAETKASMVVYEAQQAEFPLSTGLRQAT